MKLNTSGTEHFKSYEHNSTAPKSTWWVTQQRQQITIAQWYFFNITKIFRNANIYLQFHKYIIENSLKWTFYVSLICLTLVLSIWVRGLSSSCLVLDYSYEHILWFEHIRKIYQNVQSWIGDYSWNVCGKTSTTSEFWAKKTHAFSTSDEMQE